MTLTAPAGPATTPRLSTAVREGSRAEHEATEGSPFMTRLLAGGLAPAAYADYLRRLRVVYAALERAVRAHAADPAVAAVHDPALERLAAIDADLAHWAPGPAVTLPVDSPAATAYADRLAAASAQAADGWGGALLAHHYTRYLGDLSGGQAIGRLLDRAYDLGGQGTGTAFYAFPGIRPKPYKDAYRARLDALDLDASQVDAVVAEVRVAFELNGALFAELDALTD
ncbi:heme oxygenase (biliverdin-producing) [Nocardioides litoris]|uniref:biliverdin-producing heme oxygenase n=1 Tax=Nocardioides litoris TaxID=1926648 RepID=UPI00111EA632|nr:biliverdin-producing heme oxygenase [Nocardioides litoris]